MTSKYIKKRIKIDKLKIFLLKRDIFFKIYKFYKLQHPVQIRRQIPQETFDCILHGACMIYGKKFISLEDFAFVPVTYMYNEESILYDYLKYKGYKTGYIPVVSVLHMVGVSTSKRMQDYKDRLLFRFERQTESAVKQLIEREKYNKDRRGRK